MKSYHFDLGNSNTGPVGFTARVAANTPQEALALLREHLPQEYGITENDDSDYDEEPHIQNVIAYFNPDAITIEDIDEEDEI